jgi:hypothetical protein
VSKYIANIIIWLIEFAVLLAIYNETESVWTCVFLTVLFVWSECHHIDFKRHMNLHALHSNIEQAFQKTFENHSKWLQGCTNTIKIIHDTMKNILKQGEKNGTGKPA